MEYPVYGDVLGANRGVIAYANRKARKFEIGKNFELGVYTGIKYQCVEYVRRWMVWVNGLTFKNIPCAFHVWDLKHVSNIITNEKLDLKAFPNGNIHVPRPGNLLIYHSGPGIPWGHIAVITEVDLELKFVRIAEQNEFDQFWPGNYSRQLVLEKVDEKYWIRDKYQIIGWMAYHSISHIPKL